MSGRFYAISAKTKRSVGWDTCETAHLTFVVPFGALQSCGIQEEHLNSIGCPSCGTRTKEICILGPDRAIQSDRCGQNGPVLLITSAHAFSGILLKGRQSFDRNGLDDFFERVQDVEAFVDRY